MCAEETFDWTSCAALRHGNHADELGDADTGGKPHGGTFEHVGDAERNDAPQHDWVGAKVP